MVQERIAPLPEIPLRTLGDAGPAALLTTDRAAAEALLATARRRYPNAVIRLVDRISRRWLVRSENPYLAEIYEIAAALAVPGVYFLNVSYEGAAPAPLPPRPEARGRA